MLKQKSKRKNRYSVQMMLVVVSISVILLAATVLFAQTFIIVQPDMPPPTAVSLPTPDPAATP